MRRGRRRRRRRRDEHELLAGQLAGVALQDEGGGGGRLVALEHGEAQHDLGDSDEDADDDEDDDDPGDGAHFGVGDGVGEDLGEVEEHAAPLVEHLDARVDLQVLPDGGVQGVEGGLRVPEEVGDVKDI